MTEEAIAIVLAGGASRRFGSNKLAAEVHGRPLLHHALLAVAQVARELIVVIGPEDPPPPLPAGLVVPVRVARDPERHGGPLVGLAMGLAAIDDPDGLALALLVAGDMPELNPDVLRLLVDALRADPTAELAVLEHEPFAPFPAALRVAPTLAAATETLASDRRGLVAGFDRLRRTLVPSAAWRAVDPDGDTLRDVDHPRDLGQ